MIIDISFQTQLPPPYAFAAVIKCRIEEEVFIDFQQEYIGRDGLEETEILAEGFSMNDDFQWKGTIGKNWRTVLLDLEQLAFSTDPMEGPYIHISIDGTEKGFPKASEKTEFLIQELIQAVLEASERTLPLVIEITRNSSIYLLEWKFDRRELLINGNQFDWYEGSSLLSQIYAIDYESIKPSKKPSNESSIHFGDGSWYSITNKGLIESLSVMLE